MLQGSNKKMKIMGWFRGAWSKDTQCLMVPAPNINLKEKNSWQVSWPLSHHFLMISFLHLPLMVYPHIIKSWQTRTVNILTCLKKVIGGCPMPCGFPRCMTTSEKGLLSPYNKILKKQVTGRCVYKSHLIISISRP